jgi:hypothetical protein
MTPQGRVPLGVGFGLLLALGLVFFVDRGAHEPLQ